MKILLADYDLSNRELIKNILSEKYPDVLIDEVSSGKEFLEKEETNKVDWQFIITNVSCIGITNVESEEIRDRIKHIPIIVLSPIPLLGYTKFSFLQNVAAVVVFDNIQYDLCNCIERILASEKLLEQCLYRKAS